MSRSKTANTASNPEKHERKKLRGDWSYLDEKDFNSERDSKRRYFLRLNGKMNWAPRVQEELVEKFNDGKIHVSPHQSTLSAPTFLTIQLLEAQTRISW